MPAEQEASITRACTAPSEQQSIPRKPSSTMLSTAKEETFDVFFFGLISVHVQSEANSRNACSPASPVAARRQQSDNVPSIAAVDTTNTRCLHTSPRLGAWESHSESVAIHSRPRFIWHTPVHHWTVTVALDQCFQALQWLANVNSHWLMLRVWQ